MGEEQSGNPGGRPKAALDVQALARATTPEAIQALVEALGESQTKVQAAMAILAYGLGRPIQTMNVRKITSIADLFDEDLVAIAGTLDEAIADAGAGDSDTRHWPTTVPSTGQTA